MVAPSTPEALQTYMASEIERWGKVVKSAGVQME
jgi:tripartite-type tricarboxylate transporter receptor subunit TctC